MRILICHGYLLRGTGSNQYVQSLARALCRQGHHLVIACQDDDPRLDFVTVFLTEKAGIMKPQVVWEQETQYPGTCLVFKPDIGGILPVYVMDSYAGFEVKEFPHLDDEELDEYVDSSRSSLGRIIEQFVPDAIQVNHTVMLPYIVKPMAREAGVPYFVSVHGSAIEFTVKRDPRYLAYGAEGLDGASGIVVPSNHSASVLTEVFGHLVEDLDRKIAHIPPGVDTKLFDVSEESLATSVSEMLAMVESRMKGVTFGDFENHFADGGIEDDTEGLESAISRINAENPDWLPSRSLEEPLTRLAADNSPFFVFLGKLLDTKGIQCILPALPLIWREHPDVKLLVIGFGELRGVLELMLDAMDGPVLQTLERICRYGNEEYVLAKNPFSPVLSFLDQLPKEGNMDEYLRVCRERQVKKSVVFTGYLTPEEHRHLLPYAKGVLVPSLAPEAFGLVVSEAMASGVVPVATQHSGLENALEPLRRVWGSEAEKLTLRTREKLVVQIAAACNYVLEMDPEKLAERGVEMREEVKEHSSWDAVCRQLVSMFEEAAHT